MCSSSSWPPCWHNIPAVHRYSCLEEGCLGRWMRPRSAEGSPALAETRSQTLVAEAAALHRTLWLGSKE